MAPGIGLTMSRKVRILIHCDERRRDAVTISLLGFYLRDLGHEVVLCNRITLKPYDRLFDPDIIVLSHSFMYGGPEQLDQKTRRAKILVLPTEGVILSWKSAVLSYSGRPIDTPSQDRPALTKSITKIFVWGDAARRLLLDEGIYREDQVQVVGCPRFDLYQSQIFSEFRSNGSASKGIGVVGGFSSINPFDQRSFLLGLDQLRTEHGTYFDEDKNLEDYIWSQSAQFRVVLEFLDASVLEHQMDAHYRPHPNEYFGNYGFLQERLGNRLTLEQGTVPFFLWLARLYALVVTNSTTVVEAFITGVPAITLQAVLGDSLDRHVQLESHRHPLLQYCWRPRSIQEAVEMTAAAQRGELEPTDIDAPEVAKFLRDYYDWPRTEPSMATIARSIDRIAQEEVNVNGSRSTSGLRHFRNKAALLGANLLLHNLYRTHLKPVVREDIHYYPWHRSDQKLAGQVHQSLTQAAGYNPKLSVSP